MLITETVRQKRSRNCWHTETPLSIRRDAEAHVNQEILAQLPNPIPVSEIPKGKLCYS
jgi:hypothetical protein